MEQNDFLSAVLPTQGKYCTFITKGKTRKNIFVDTLDNLYNTNIRLSEDGNQSYFALATFDGEGSREAAHAQYMRALFIDLDCGEGKAYPTKRAAVEALHDFMQKTGLDTLGTPWLVDSGGGVHAHLPFAEDATIAEWKPVAEALKRAARTHGFNIDMTVTADAARVLRCPGTFNYKYSPAKPVVLRQRGSVFDLASVADALTEHAPAPNPISTALALPGRRPQAALTVVAKALVGTSVTRFVNIVKRTTAGTGCGQLEHYFTHAQDDGMEPLWRGWLSIASKCDDGDKACIKLTQAHPYDEDRMHSKMREIKGPYPCAKFDSENPGICGNCVHWGKITNPLALGRELKTVTEETVVERETPSGESVRYDRPKPPFRFSYGTEGGVFYSKPAEKKGEEETLILLTPYDFYMTRMFRDGQVYQAEFKVIKGDRQFTFAVPTAVITSQAECMKTLASNNVIASFAGYDPYMYQYVRQSMMQASAEGNEVVVPPNFGWQDDNSFAFGDTVYSPHSPEYNYTYVSDRLGNVIRAVEPKGSVAEWRKVLELMRRKQLWGHLAIAGTGFASPLMHFMPAGSRAVTTHVCGKDSGMGKTFAMAVANSVNGLHENYVVPPATSKTTLLQRAGFLGSCHLPIDEITNLQHASEREFMPQLIFDYSQGQHKLKGSATGNAEIAQELFWEGIQLTSANTPVLEAMMGARQVTSEGEARRVLEWNLPDGYKLVWGPGEFEVSQLIKENYGVAMRAYAQWLVLNQETAQEVARATRKAWVEFSGAVDDERFWSSGVASYIAGFILAGPKYANIVDIPWEPIMNFWLTEVVNPARAIINANQSHAMDILNAYIRENNPNFVQVEGSVVMQNLTGQNFAVSPNSDRRLVRGRVERNVTPGYEDLYIEAKMLKMHCAALNRGYTAFLKELSTVASVTEVRKDLLAGTKGPSMRVAVVKVTRVL
jgi:hypothetical protein